VCVCVCVCARSSHIIVKYGQLFFYYCTAITYQQLVLQCPFFLKQETEQRITSAGLLRDPLMEPSRYVAYSTAFLSAFKTNIKQKDSSTI